MMANVFLLETRGRFDYQTSQLSIRVLGDIDTLWRPFSHGTTVVMAALSVDGGRTALQNGCVHIFITTPPCFSCMMSNAMQPTSCHDV